MVQDAGLRLEAEGKWEEAREERLRERHGGDGAARRRRGMGRGGWGSNSTAGPSNQAPSLVYVTKHSKTGLRK